ncbi:MAG TPA: hypothetical protein VMT36_01290, partial [Candidatus Saccharimonadia bacterium]|nr:hypothetical protein [Candidatus Saccharimonadia bacterium]
MRAVLLGISALGLCLAGSLGMLRAEFGPPVTIAVLRGDGVLIPIVTRTGTKWSNTWPVPVKALDVPLGLDGIPKRWWGKSGAATTWHAWQIDGTTSEVAIERPTWYLAHCQQGIGLKTSLTARPPLPPPTVQPYPKLGLASTSPLAFQRIEPVDQGDPMWIKVAEAVGAATSKAEDVMDTRRVINSVPQLKHPTPAADRARVAAHVEALYRVPYKSGRSLYYVEATKRYGMPPVPAGSKALVPSPKEGCSVMTFANGFFVDGADGTIPPPSLNVRVTSCDYDTVSLMLPLGTVGEGDA